MDEEQLNGNIEEKTIDENVEQPKDDNSETQEREKEGEKEKIKLVKRQGTVTYKAKGKNVGMPIEDNSKILGMGAGRTKRKSTRGKKK